MEIKIVDNQIKWDNWLKTHSFRPSFAQSWDWGDVLIAEGRKIERLAVIDNGEIIAQAQVIYQDLPLGMRYTFCPKGPIIDQKYQDQISNIYKELISHFKSQDCIFFRTEPTNTLSTCPPSLRSGVGRRAPCKKTIDINPRATLLIDLTKSETDLLATMHAKTRYNIRLAEKKSLKISTEKNLEIFWNLMKTTGERDGFKLHAKNHYQQILSSNITHQLTAFQNNQAVATAVFINFGDTFTYLFGASDHKFRALMAPYLLQWEGIKFSKKSGCKYYDFFGISPGKIKLNGEFDYNPKHQYAKVTRFKLGFGGAYHEDPGTFDVVVNKNKYRIYQLLRLVRRFF